MVFLTKMTTEFNQEMYG